MSFDPQAWLAEPGLPLCSLAAQGLWMHLLCRMWSSPERGVLLKADGTPPTVREIGMWVRLSEADAKQTLSELAEQNVSATDEQGRICNRRMLRAAKQTASKVEAGRRGGSALAIEARETGDPNQTTPLVSAPPPLQGCPYEEIVAAWNKLARECGLQTIRALTPSRKVKMRLRWLEWGGDNWREIWAQIAAGFHNWPWGCGKDPKSDWRADIDYLIRNSEYWVKMVERSEGTMDTSQQEDDGFTI